jgi:hypothetical protein
VVRGTLPSLRDRYLDVFDHLLAEQLAALLPDGITRAQLIEIEFEIFSDQAEAAVERILTEDLLSAMHEWYDVFDELGSREEMTGAYRKFLDRWRFDLILEAFERALRVLEAAGESPSGLRAAVPRTIGPIIAADPAYYSEIMGASPST